MKYFRSNNKCCFLSLLLSLFLIVDTLSASTVTVANASFELPYVGAGQAGFSIDIWSINGTAGIAGNGWGGGQINLTNSDGVQIAWMNTNVDTSVSQMLADTYRAGCSYTLTAGFARGAWNPTNDGDQIQLQLYYESAGTKVVLGSVTATASELNASDGQELKDYTVAIPEISASEAYVGLQIGVRVISSYEAPEGGDGDWVIDNIRLEYEQISDPGVDDPVIITADDPYIQYFGRINFDNTKQPVLWWPGNYITAWFEGTSVKVKFNDMGNNYFAVVIDDNPETILDLGSGTGSYLVASGLSDGVHKILLHKRTETNVNSNEGSVGFLGFELDPGKHLVAPKPKPYKKIEFYGDSITAGYAVDSTNDSGAAPYKNNYLDYSARTARMLNAQMHCQAISGVGIYKSWWQYPYGDNASMYEDYYFLETPGKNWDFSKWIPQVVVINLGENDKNVGGVTQAQAEGYYRDFALALRGYYPEAHIIFALGSMSAADSDTWKGYITNVVNTLNSAPYSDGRVYKLFFEKIHDSANRHPVASEHLIMAQHLSDFILEIEPAFGYKDGDIDGDGKVTISDFSTLSSNWLGSDCQACYGADIDGDADIDLVDMEKMAANWLEDLRLEGWWKFDGNLTDSSWKNRSAMTVNGNDGDMLSTSGQVSFDGSNYIEISDYDGILGGGQRTVFVRMKTTVNSGSIICWGQNVVSGKWDLQVNSSGVVALGVFGGRIDGTTNITDGNWHNIAVVLDGYSPDVSQVAIYIDGYSENISSVMDAPVNTLSNGVITIGNGLPSRYFTGNVDEVRIYNKALSAEEISEI